MKVAHARIRPIKHTEKAVLLSASGREFWMPKSQIRAWPAEWPVVSGIATAALTDRSHLAVSDSIALDKGLQVDGSFIKAATVDKSDNPVVQMLQAKVKLLERDNEKLRQDLVSARSGQSVSDVARTQLLRERDEAMRRLAAATQTATIASQIRDTVVGPRGAVTAPNKQPTAAPAEPEGERFQLLWVDDD